MSLRKTAISVFASCSIFFVGTLQAGTPAKKSNTHAVPQAWAPVPFPADGVLPKNFTGLDVRRVWALFKSKEDSLKKGEYETTIDYEERVAATDLSPLNRDERYALALADEKLSYDADSQQFSVTDYAFCGKTLEFGEGNDWVTCKIASLSSDHSTYVGTNGFGAKAVIDKTTGTDFGIAVKADSPFLASAIFKHDQYSAYLSSYDLAVVLPLPLERARTLQGQSLGILLVGKFGSPKLVDGYPILSSPTVSEPTDLFIRQDAVPFLPEEVVYYVLETGEILATQALGTDGSP